MAGERSSRGDRHPGGLSHFCLDEDFDRALLAAIQKKDRTFTQQTGSVAPPAKGNEGSVALS